MLLSQSKSRLSFGTIVNRIRNSSPGTGARPRPKISVRTDAPTTDTTTDATPSRPVTVLPVPGTAAAHRRSVDHQGWLDRRTISTGRKGIAAARAALASANQRVADRQAQEEADRKAELARQASGLARRDIRPPERASVFHELLGGKS